MKFIGRLIALFWGGLMLASIVGMFAARAAKLRIVSVDEPEADEVAVTAFFEPIHFRSTARKFRGGTVDCWYGGGAIDLRDAVLDEAGAHLKVRAIFGGGQILVPETWQVGSSVLGIGGLADTRPQVERADDAPRLTIEGVAIFGGFAVASEMPEKEALGLDKAIEKSSRRRHHEPKASPQVEPAA